MGVDLPPDEPFHAGDYERIPLTRDHARLLEIDAKQGTKVIEQTIEQIKNPPPETARK